MIMYQNIHPQQVQGDGDLTGTISGGGTSAEVNAIVGCDNGIPFGTFFTTITKTVDTTTTTYNISSDTAIIVATLTTPPFVGAVFENVTVTNTTTQQVFEGCTAEITAVKLSPDLWEGSFEVTCPGGPVLAVFGGFTGTVTVVAPVLCTPPVAR